MAETWHEEAALTLIAVGIAYEPLPQHERDTLAAKLNPALTVIHRHYPDAKAGDEKARYAILDACDDVATVLDGYRHQPTPGTIGYRLRQAQAG